MFFPSSQGEPGLVNTAELLEWGFWPGNQRQTAHPLMGVRGSLATVRSAIFPCRHFIATAVVLPLNQPEKSFSEMMTLKSQLAGSSSQAVVSISLGGK